MLRLVIAALGARRAQTVALLTLTALAALGASAAPWYLAWSRGAVAAADLASAPPELRVVRVGGAAPVQPGSSPFGPLRDRVDQHIGLAGATGWVGARIYVSARNAVARAGTSPIGLYVSYREDVCSRLRVEGTCPATPDDVILSRDTAALLGVRPGDAVILEGFGFRQPVTLRISGLYRVVDFQDVYWAGTNLFSAGTTMTLIGQPAFVGEQAMLAMPAERLDLDMQLVLPDLAFTEPRRAGELASTFARAGAALRDDGLSLTTSAATLAQQIARDQLLVGRSVTIAAVQLALLCWVALFLAVRHTAVERRGDLGLLKLRGTSRRRLWTLAAQPSALPMLAGASLGWVLGYLTACALAGGRWIPVAGSPTLGLSAAAAAVACLGALVAAVVAERGTLRQPVLDLLRRVPGRERGWRGGVTDLAIVAIAVAGVYQARAEPDGAVSHLALLAPGLVALAVALLAARALPWLAARAGAAGLRAGRPGVALTGLQLARRPGTHRVFAVLSVAVSVLVIDAGYWYAAHDAWARRAAFELGAPRVLTVRAPSSSALMAAVRAVDPSGRYAMAVARSGASATLAVDSTRLASVAVLPPEYGAGDPATIERRLRPPTLAPIRVDAGELTLEARDAAAPDAPAPAQVRLHLAQANGSVRTVDVGPLGPDRGAHRATVSGCAGGCRLIAIELVSPMSATATVELYRLAQGGRELVSGDQFGDVTRWRGPVGTTGVGNLIISGDGRLSLTLYSGQLPPGKKIDARIFVADSPVPVPTVLAGDRPKPDRPGDERLLVLGSEHLPYVVVGTAAVLPQLGPQGALVDLEYALRAIGGAYEFANFEVWLAADTPDTVVAGLDARGVEVLTDTTAVETADRLADQGPGIALRFHLLGAAILLLLAAGTVWIMGSVQRRARAGELAALRAQGLSGASVRRAGYGGWAVLVAGAVLSGLLAAAIGGAVVAAALPVFADDWALLPWGQARWAVALAAAALGAVVLGAAAALASAGLVRAARKDGTP